VVVGVGALRIWSQNVDAASPVPRPPGKIGVFAGNLLLRLLNTVIDPERRYAYMPDATPTAELRLEASDDSAPDVARRTDAAIRLLGVPPLPAQ
jgi:hypothetical protein